MSPESPEQEADYTLTPRTEAKYNKIDEDFQIMMQRNQQITGQRVGMAGGTYTLPVTVPLSGGYNDSGMLQASPQMAHTNISPRPSSSETDSGKRQPPPTHSSLIRFALTISFGVGNRTRLVEYKEAPFDALLWRAKRF